MDLPDEPDKLTPAQWREIQEAIGGLAERNGLPPPRPNLAPEVYIGPGSDVREAAISLGQICRDEKKGLFLADKEIVTIDREKGGTEIMEEDAFQSWIADHALIGKKWDKATGKLEKCSIGVQLARGVLAARHFRQNLPRLSGVNMVKQPVRRRNGDVVLLPQGYDEESQIFTVEGGLDYPDNMDIEEAVVFWRALFGTFPWGDDGRSLAVHTAAALTLFCANMLPRGTLTPMFLYNANMAGSGKSVLVSVVLWALFGQADTMGIPDGEDDFKKELDACAQALKPYAFFDEQSGFIENKRLNAWVTSRNWAGRVLSTNRMFSMPKRAVTIMAGNMVSLTPDLGRRTMIADLFSKTRLEDRKLPQGTILITDDWMQQDEHRAKVLAALWAFVRHSCVPREEEMDPDGKGVRKVMVTGRILGTGQRARPTNRALDSFETWSSIVPQIVVDAAFSDPLERPNLPDAGDKGGREMDRLMKALIKEKLYRRVPLMREDPGTGEDVETGQFDTLPLPAAKVELSDMVAVARRLGLFSEILETTDLVLVTLERAGKGRGFWEEEFAGGLLKTKEVRLPESEEEKKSQAERWYDKSMATKFSSRFRGKQGQYFTGECGGIFQLGDRVSARVSTFLIKRV